jgi:peptidoglycan/LPS O-acetylase OafA/YrhL
MTTSGRVGAAILDGMADATLVSSRPRRGATNLSAVPYLPGLDGMRALAVVAVMIYHANSEWLHGGFLGVEVFFVVSGYLITMLLMAEREQTGRIDLFAFWGRRIRRLLPALYLMMFLLLTYSMIFKGSVLGQIRGDFGAAILYVSNWYQIWVGQGYTSSNDFVPMRHLWSLAVEEQFYLVWPAVMMLLLARNGGTRRLAMTARWLVITALGVTVAVAVLHHSGTIGECDVTPEAYWTIGGRCVSKADALYLSTITRSSGLLLGSAFAMVWRPRAIMRSRMRDRNRLLDLVALIGLALLGLQFWFLHVSTPSGADPWLFRGGFLVTSVATLMVIAAITHRYTLTSRLLSVRPLRWVGTRSYGLYLYHWPIYQIFREVAGNALTWQQFVASMLITIPLTELSYRFLEIPIRRRQFARWWEGLRRRPSPVPRQVMGAMVVVSLLLLAAGVIRLGLAEVNPNSVAASLEEGSDHTVDLNDLLPDSNTTLPAPTTQATQPPASVVATTESTTTTSTTTTTTTTTLPAEPVDFLAIGDSVMLGAAKVLEGRGYTVDAHQNRQMIDIIPLMQQLGEADLFGDPVIIHLGTNGPFDKETLDALLAPLSKVPNVIILNVHANRSWTANNNALLAERDVDGDNIYLIDWDTLALACPGSCFAPDGIHLNADGQEYYADLIGDFTGK